MATYAELLLASENEALKKKLQVAVVVAAETIRTEDTATLDHVLRLAWAKQVFIEPDAAASRMMWPVLAQNKEQTYAAIIGATDVAVQTAVNAAVNVFI